ncbi:alpha/beta hydrolase [Spirochaetia bacterium]|nr:alpha/beta hydrolase [Spirochaetia bacterium]
MKNKLYYNTEASVFEEALPVGNGKLGGMVYGGTKLEHISLNEDTLWSGTGPAPLNPKAKAALSKVRKQIFAGDLAGAQELIPQDILCDWTSAYMPLGDLYIQSDIGNVEAYERSLDLETAIHTCAFRCDGVSFMRELFCSYPARAMVIRQSAGTRGVVSLSLRLSSKLESTVCAEDGFLVLRGRCPTLTAPFYFSEDPLPYGEGSIGFELRLWAVAEGGEQHCTDEGIEVKGADRVTIFLCAATSFSGYDRPPQADPHQINQKTYKALESRRWDDLKAEHVADYAPLFGRVSLDLGESPDQPTDRRLELLAKGADDPGLIELAFQYGRYLLLACSRPGSQPANLQGIWNESPRPPWSSNYTLNINTEMNYWAALPCALSECQEPLFDMISELAVAGGKTARESYGCRGWVCHHNTDIWRSTAPIGRLGVGIGYSPERYGMWPMAGPWLCRHLWDHYLYTQDKFFLEEKAYPLMRGCAEFLLDWLVEGPGGYLVTNPSVSPENEFIRDGKGYSAATASTMDISLIRELFTNCLSALDVLGKPEDIRSQIEAALKRLPPYKTGASGGLQEWFNDEQEAEPAHRHISHLYGLYPSNQMPETLYEACRKTLTDRGDDGSGWSLTWKAAAWASLGDGEHAAALLKRQLRFTADNQFFSTDGGTYPNLLSAHPPFQIDASLGFPAAVAAMLVQNRLGGVVLLPALPPAWRRGSVRGLRAHGGITLDIYWDNGILVKALVQGFKPPCTLSYREKTWTAQAEGLFVIDNQE